MIYNMVSCPRVIVQRSRRIVRTTLYVVSIQLYIYIRRERELRLYIVPRGGVALVLLDREKYSTIVKNWLVPLFGIMYYLVPLYAGWGSSTPPLEELCIPN